MSPLRTLIVLVVFVALGVIEIWSGFGRRSVPLKQRCSRKCDRPASSVVAS